MVTGGCGFVGSSLVRMLVDDGEWDVTVLDDCSLGVPENLGEARERVRIAAVDIRDGALVSETMRTLAPQVVIHLAAIHFIPACDADPKRCVDVNTGGTQAVLANTASDSGKHIRRTFAAPPGVGIRINMK